MFNNTDLEGVEDQQDRLGGSYTLDSGVYDGTVKLAYVVNASSSNSKCIVTVYEFDGKELTDRVWIFNKAGKPTYEKNNKKFMLPGYEAMNDLALVTTGLPLTEQTIEEKTIKIWDSTEKKEVEKSVPCVTSIMGKQVTAGVIKAIVNKQAKDASGDYVDTDEQREINEISKFFHTESRKTVVELKSGTDLPEEDLFISKWGEKNSGATQNRFKPVTAAGAAASGAGSPKTASKPLFGN